MVATLLNARGDTVRTDINPGLRYLEAFLLGQNVPRATRDTLLTNDWTGQRLSGKEGEMLSGYNQEFRLLRAAAQATVPCDWGLDMSEGPELLLPHLAQAKAASQIVQLRAMWDLQNGKQAEARDDLLAVLALARNISRDGTLISVLVQIAMENILISTVAQNYYEFTPETLQQIARGFADAPPRGTVAESINTGERSFVGWFAQKVREARDQHPGDEAAALASLHKLFDNAVGSGDGQNTGFADKVFRAAGGTTDGLERLINELPPLYDHATKVMSLPPDQFVQEMKLLTIQIQNSPNPLIAELFPALTKSRSKEFSILGKIEMLHAAVEYKLHGEAGFNAVMDPLGNGPFKFEPFFYQGARRGFKVSSPYSGAAWPQAMIFVEKPGPVFQIAGPHIGEARRRD